MNLKPGQHCVITLSNSGYHLAPIQKIGMPKTNGPIHISCLLHHIIRDEHGRTPNHSPPDSELM